ncbi:MAG TPA: TonB-dependent receptor [Opitutaceae bacterium]
MSKPTVFSHPSSRCRVLLAALCCALVSTSRAQPAADASSSASGAEEVITIPEFQVSGNRDRDAWLASQAMSGTRTSAAIIDLPYQVQVVTQEFLEDFQLVGLSEQMSYFSGYSGVADQADAAIGGTLGGSTLRGFPQTVLRDGFRRTPPPQIGNTAQVEVIKGPISTLYGDAAPGGLINYVSKRPSVRPTSSLSLSGGSYDYFRSNVSSSGPLVGNKLFYLVSADNYYRKSETQYTYARNGDYTGTLLFKPTPSTSISVNYEMVRLVGARAATVPSLVVGTRPSGTNPLAWTGGTIVGIDWRLAEMGYSRFGPGERYERDYDGLNIMVEHAYNDRWKQRIGYQGQWKSFELNYRTNSNVSAETNRMTGVAPNRRLQDIDSPVAIQTDLLGHFETGPLKHALLFTADYAEEETKDVQLRLPTAQEATLPDFYRYHDPFNPDWSPIIDYSQLTRRASKNFEKMESRGGSVSDRVSIADGRLIVMGNVRYDKADFATDSSAAVDRFTYGDADSTTYNAGANLKLLGDALVAFANHSTSFNTNITVDRNTGTTIPNEEGKGYEAGFKSLAFDGRLGFTVSGYEIEKSNIGQTNPDFVLGNGEPEFLGSGKERVRGVDGDVNVRFSDALTLIAGASYLDARVVASSNAALVNTRKLNVPRTSGSLALRYTFSGPLKGLSAGASLRYTGGYVRANATATRLYEEGAAKQIYSAFIAYSWRRERLGHTVRLNGNNLFDKFYLGPDLNLGLGRQINVTYTLSFR